MNSSLLSSSSLLHSSAVFPCNQNFYLPYFQRHCTWGTCLSNMATSTLFRSQRISPSGQMASYTGFKWVALCLIPPGGEFNTSFEYRHLGQFPRSWSHESLLCSYADHPMYRRKKRSIEQLEAGSPSQMSFLCIRAQITGKLWYSL